MRLSHDSWYRERHVTTSLTSISSHSSARKGYTCTIQGLIPPASRLAESMDGTRGDSRQQRFASVYTLVCTAVRNQLEGMGANRSVSPPRTSRNSYGGLCNVVTSGRSMIGLAGVETHDKRKGIQCLVRSSEPKNPIGTLLEPVFAHLLTAHPSASQQRKCWTRFG